MSVSNRFDEIRELALALLGGATAEAVDSAGRRWRATADELAIVFDSGATGTVLLGDAFTIAARLVAVRGSDVAGPDQCQ